MRDLKALYESDPPAAVSRAHGFDLEALERRSHGSQAWADALFLATQLRAEPEQHHLRLRRCLSSAVDPRGDGIVLDPDVTQNTALRLAPSWPSSIEALDEKQAFRGLTVLSGGTGLGKSTLAVASSVEACREEDLRQVIYLNAELDRATLCLYVQRRHGLSRDQARERMLYFAHLEVTPAATLESLVARCLPLIEPGTQRLVLVLDSVNTICEKLQTERENYLRTLNRVGCWMLEARRLSGGDVGFLAISELNRDGELVGRRLDKWADTVVKMSRAEQDDYVHFQVTKGRYSGIRDLGDYWHDHVRCRFQPPAQPREGREQFEW